MDNEILTELWNTRNKLEGPDGIHLEKFIKKIKKITGKSLALLPRKNPPA